MCSHDAGEHGLLVHLNIVEGFKCKREVAEKAVNAKQADDREVAEHAIQGAGAILASDGHGFFIALLRGKLFVDLRTLDQRIEDVEDAVAAPCIWILTKDLGFRLIRSGSCDSVAVPTEGFELVDELINYIPRPVVLVECELWELEEDLVILTFGTSRSTGPSELSM